MMHNSLITLSKNEFWIYEDYREEFSREFKYRIDTMKIRNPESWKVAKLSDFLMKKYSICSEKDVKSSLTTLTEGYVSQKS
jgi:hypothetical protein